MNKNLDTYVHTCPHCKERKLNSYFRGNHKGAYYNPKLKMMRDRYFCTKECYEDYSNQFIVEVYNGKPIYCIEVDGEKRYMPYFEAFYYFTDIEDCKKRMATKNVAVVNMGMHPILSSMNY